MPPPHVPAALLGVAMTRPADSVAVNPTALMVTALSEKMSRIRSTCEPRGIACWTKNALSVGGTTTVMNAIAGVPLPASAANGKAVTIFGADVPVPETLTLIVHDAPGASTTLPAPIKFPPATGATVPPQGLLTPGGVATTRPAGSGRLKPAVSGPVLIAGFVSVKLSAVAPPTATVEAANARLRLGGVATTTVAVTFGPLPPLSEWMLETVLTN